MPSAEASSTTERIDLPAEIRNLGTRLHAAATSGARRRQRRTGERRRESQSGVSARDGRRSAGAAGIRFPARPRPSARVSCSASSSFTVRSSCMMLPPPRSAMAAASTALSPFFGFFASATSSGISFGTSSMRSASVAIVLKTGAAAARAHPVVAGRTVEGHHDHQLRIRHRRKAHERGVVEMRVVVRCFENLRGAGLARGSVAIQTRVSDAPCRASTTPSIIMRIFITVSGFSTRTGASAVPAYRRVSESAVGFTSMPPFAITAHSARQLHRSGADLLAHGNGGQRSGAPPVSAAAAFRSIPPAAATPSSAPKPKRLRVLVHLLAAHPLADQDRADVGRFSSTCCMVMVPKPWCDS